MGVFSRPLTLEDAPAVAGGLAAVAVGRAGLRAAVLDAELRADGAAAVCRAALRAGVAQLAEPAPAGAAQRDALERPGPVGPDAARHPISGRLEDRSLSGS